ncbi:MAG: hypothetical protein K2X69_09705 [Silvanigrellaceae bacterium]|nr:hypothetical protein [Silvanigrellaceae bacterium]
MTIHDLNLIEEALKNDLNKDLILKIINHTKQIVLSHAKETNQLKSIINKFSTLGFEETEGTEENDILIKKFPDKKISLLVDTTEYNLKEVAEILGVSYKHCNRLFVKYNIPFVRREKNGSIFLGKTIKKHFNAEKSNNFLEDCS